MSAQSEALIPVTDIIEVACAAYRTRGYTAKYKGPDARGLTDHSNAKMITDHFYGMKEFEVTDEDKLLAEDVCEYFKGLGFKMLQRDLSEFEAEVLRFVAEEKQPLWKSGFAGVLPKIYEDQMQSDEWTSMERDLGKNSEFVGSVGVREDFHVLVKYTKLIPSNHYTFVVGLVNGKDIVKFYMPQWLNLVPTVDRVVRISGIPKDHSPGHKTSSLTKAKETCLCRVFTERSTHCSSLSPDKL